MKVKIINNDCSDVGKVHQAFIKDRMLHIIYNEPIPMMPLLESNGMCLNKLGIELFGVEFVEISESEKQDLIDAGLIEKDNLKTSRIFIVNKTVTVFGLTFEKGDIYVECGMDVFCNQEASYPKIHFSYMENVNIFSHPDKIFEEVMTVDTDHIWLDPNDPVGKKALDQLEEQKRIFDKEQANKEGAPASLTINKKKLLERIVKVCYDFYDFGRMEERLGRFKDRISEDTVNMIRRTIAEDEDFPELKEEKGE